MLCGIAVSICGASMGLLFSALLPNVQVALAIFPLVFMPLMLVSGLFVNNGSIPPYIDWLKYLSPMKYGFEALVKNQFTGWSRSFDVRLPSGVITSVTTNGEDVISQLGMDDGLSVASLLAILFSLYVGLTISSALGLFSATRKKRH